MDQDPSKEGAAPQHLHRSRPMRPAVNNKNSAPNPRRVGGQCTVLAGKDNLATDPCPDIVLVLQDAQGKELLRTRTSSHGRFEFMTDEAGPFKIRPLSKLYEVSSPDQVTEKAKPVDLKLEQK